MKEGWWLSMASKVLIGPYSAYGIAVKYGYKGTEEEWAAEQEINRTVAVKAAQDAADAAKQAAQAATNAQASVEQAGPAAQSAAASAAQAAQSASEAGRAKTDAEAALANLQQTIDNKLQEAKDSGEFDGPPGQQGIQGPQGPAGNILFATFGVNEKTGRLTMTTPDEYSGPVFSINDTGHLEVSIHG